MGPTDPIEILLNHLDGDLSPSGSNIIKINYSPFHYQKKKKSYSPFSPSILTLSNILFGIHM